MFFLVNVFIALPVVVLGIIFAILFIINIIYDKKIQDIILCILNNVLNDKNDNKRG